MKQYIVDAFTARKSIFGFLRETLSEPSGRFATLSACDRCPPCSVPQFAV